MSLRCQGLSRHDALAAHQAGPARARAHREAAREASLTGNRLGALTGIAEQIAAAGWTRVPGFIEPGLVAALRELALGLDASGDFRPAAVGSGPRRAVRPEIRGDRILWLHDAPSPVEREVLARFERLRLELNQELTLGLFEFECHFALYPPGAGYARHLDQFAGDARRTVSAVLYLNPDWQPAQGGELRLYLDDGSTVDIRPEAGTLAVFLSERFWHEVLPATRERLSLTGWFRRR